jgi:hypothetical protein
MAATVLNGSGNLSYTNNTGGNIRAIIYYMSSYSTSTGQALSVTSSFGTTSGSSTSGSFAIGKGIAGSTSIANVSTTSQNIGAAGGGNPLLQIPTQIMLANGQSISALCGGYNIAIIPENG